MFKGLTTQVNKAVTEIESTLITEIDWSKAPQAYPDSPQEKFVKSKASITLFGGAAGGGKTFGILIAALQGVYNPRYSSVIFRRTYPEISRPGGLLDESQAVYGDLGCKLSRNTWKFSTGASISFSHLQHEKDKFAWKGAQVPTILFDELTSFTEGQFWYLMSRNRFPHGEGKLQPSIKCTTNPDADSWVRKLLDWWIDDESGLPIPERSAKIRYFVRPEGDELVWSSDYDDLLEKFKDRKLTPKSFTFIPSKLTDNPRLIENDPTYIGSLQALHPVERDRLLYGNWNSKMEAGKVFSTSWFDVISVMELPDINEGVCVRFWDLAATDSEVRKDACYTVGVLMQKVDTSFYIRDVIAEQFNPSKVERLLKDTANRDGVNILQRWEKQPAAAGKWVDRDLVNVLAGFDAKPMDIRGSKVQRATGFATQAYNGNVSIIKFEQANGYNTDRYLSRLVKFPKEGLDEADASSGAFNCLLKENVLSSIF